MSTFTIPNANRPPVMNRNATIVISVIALHVAVLWAMQTGLLRRVAEAVVPAEILVEIMAPMPTAQPATQPAPRPKMAQKSVQPKPTQPAPAPMAAIQPAPNTLAQAPSATTPEPSATSPNTLAAAPSAPPANTGSKADGPSTPAAAPKVELPSSSADYLNNPKPAYPKRSWQLHEQGKVVVRVWIGTDGTASQASVKTSSGFDRLDQAAVTTVLAWRYVPGKRGGVAEAMWFDVPVNWVLQ